MDDRLKTTLQQNLLALLCFDDAAYLLVRNSVTPSMFMSEVYREIVATVFSFVDQYKRPPKEHTLDLFEEQLRAKSKTSELFETALDTIHQLASTIDRAYVLQQLESFARCQRLKLSIIEASEALQQDDLTTAERVWRQSLKELPVNFSPGITLEQAWPTVAAGDARKCYNIGIRELDEERLGPAVGEFLLFIAPPKRGKSWWLVHLAKQLLLQRARVLYVTLEISDVQIATRLMQALFSLSRHKAKTELTNFTLDDLGRLVGLTRESIKVDSLDDPTKHKQLFRKLKGFHGHSNLIIKSFPAGRLTVAALEAYLESLEQSAGFIPNVVLIDYADLMTIDSKNYRIDLGVLYKDLRGLADVRRFALVSASQANRQAAKALLVTDIHTAEDYSKIGTVDTAITYTQTLPEKELGLARLFVSNTRVGDNDRFVVLINQSYKMGQFCLESVRMSDQYFNMVAQLKPDVPIDDGDSDD